MSKLYKVIVSTDVMVLADSKEQACSTARNVLDKEIQYCKESAIEVKSLKDIPENWHNNIPYWANNVPESTTWKDMIEEYLEEVKVDTKEVKEIITTTTPIISNVKKGLSSEQKLRF